MQGSGFFVNMVNRRNIGDELCPCNIGELSESGKVTA
jgi:hypothetical protein